MFLQAAKCSFKVEKPPSKNTGNNQFLWELLVWLEFTFNRCSYKQERPFFPVLTYYSQIWYSACLQTKLCCAPTDLVHRKALLPPDLVQLFLIIWSPPLINSLSAIIYLLLLCCWNNGLDSYPWRVLCKNMSNTNIHQIQHNRQEEKATMH